MVLGGFRSFHVLVTTVSQNCILSYFHTVYRERFHKSI